MGYMQEIIRRGNVKYFISQKQENVNKPVDNIGDIGSGSAWYIQEERPYVIQGEIAHIGAETEIRKNIQAFTGEEIWVQNLSLSGAFWKYVVYAIQKQRPGECVESQLMTIFGSGSDGTKYSYYLDFLLSGYTFQIQGYKNDYTYLDIINSQTSSKKAKCGIRADINKKIIYFGILGKINFPQDISEFFAGFYYDHHLSKVNPSYNFYTSGECRGVFGGWNFILKLEQIISVSRVINATGLFSFLPNVESKKMAFKYWTFSSCKNMKAMFYQSFAAPMSSSSGWSGSGVLSKSWAPHQQNYLQELDLSIFDTALVQNMQQMFAIRTSNFTGGYLTNIDYFGSITTGTSSYPLKKIYVLDNFITTNVTNSTAMFSDCRSLIGGAGTVWSDSNPKDKTYAHWDEGMSNPGYFWNPNVMDPLILVSGPQFNAVWLAAVNAAAAAAGSDRAPSIQQITGEFTFMPMSSKPTNLQTLPNNNVKESGDGEAYIGYTYNVTDRSFKVYLVSDNIGEGNIKANPNCTDMFALDSAVPGSLTMNIEWLNTSQVTNMENMFGIKGV